jgi:hypothetical protein
MQYPVNDGAMAARQFLGAFLFESGRLPLLMFASDKASLLSKSLSFPYAFFMRS